MNGVHLVDSSGWLEYFADGPNAGRFAGPLSEPGRLVVPTVSLYEVFRVVLRERGEDDAIRAAARLQPPGIEARATAAPRSSGAGRSSRPMKTIPRLGAGSSSCGVQVSTSTDRPLT